MSDRSRSRTPARALVPVVPLHVEYVAPGPGEAIDAVAFVVRTVTDPVVAALFAACGLAITGALLAYLRVAPRVPDVAVLRGTLAGYADLVPWMLRLSMGLPLLGAGFAGYLFSPAVATTGGLRLVLVGLGFALLVGLATRVTAVATLGLYLVTVALHPGALLAMEYVPGLVAIAILGGGRPSADEMFGDVADAEGTLFGRLDPFHRPASVIAARLDPARRYVPVVVRVGLGVTFVYLGVVEKLLDPGHALTVVAKYDLTAVVPVAPEVWVLGAGLAEIALGLALLAGLFTRAGAAAAFALFTVTLFGLPDDPVLAHVTLFGLASVVFTLGSGPLALDRRVGGSAPVPVPGARHPR